MKLITLLFFLVLFAKTQISAIVGIVNATSQATCEICSADWFHQFHHDAELPIESDSKPTESNTPEVKEPTDHENDEWGKVLKSFALARHVSITSSQNQIRTLQRDLQNRSTVSRIILHRCWKSFLVCG